MNQHRSRSPLEWTMITLILLCAAWLRFHDLGNIPKGLEHDEVATWHMVEGVLDGNRPLYFEEGYGHEPLYNYLTALPMAVFGPNWLGERFWAPWLGLLAVAATYALIRRLFGPGVALSAAGFQATVLWAFFFNRLGLRLNLLPFLLCVTVYCFWRALEAAGRARIGWFVASGALMGLCLYTYMSSRMVPVILGAFTLYLVARDRWFSDEPPSRRPGWRALASRWWPVLLCFAVTVLVASPLMLYLLNRPATNIPQREGQVDMPLRELRQGNLKPVLENAWGLIKMWNVDGERYWQLNYGHRPVFVEPISGVLFWVGALAALWHWRDPRAALLVMWTGAGMVPSLLTSEAPSWPRTMLASPAALTLPGFAVWSIVEWGKRSRFRLPVWTKQVLWGLVALSFLLTFAFTWRDFLVVWPNHHRVRFAFQSSLTEAFRALDQMQESPPVVMAGLSPHDMDPWTEACTLQRRDLDLRWTDVRSAWVLPAEPARLVTLDITPVDPALGSWLGLDELPVLDQGEIVPRGGMERDTGAPVYRDPAYVIYDLDTEALLARVDKAQGAAYVGANPADAVALETSPTFGELVRLVGHTWLHEPQAGQPAQVLTFWQALGTGPASTVYGEPALRIFFHLLDGDQQVVAAADVLGAAPDTWLAGDTIVQLHTFVPAAPGTYAVEVGWYVPPNGPRLVVDRGGVPGERVLLDPVEIR